MPYLDPGAEATELLRRAELRAGGISARTEARMVRSGNWSRPVGDVVVLGPMGPGELLRAGLFMAGERVAVCQESAGQVWLERELNRPLHLLVPFGRRIRDTDWVRFHQTRYWTPPTVSGGVPVTDPVTTAVAIAAGGLREADRRALVTGLVQRGLATPREIAVAATRSPRRMHAQVGRLVEEVLAGVESGPEAAFWRAQVEARMPVPVLNHPLRGGARYLDGYLEQLQAGYEVQSEAHHGGRWKEDSARFAEILVQDGITLLPVLVADIERRISKVLADLDGFWRNQAALLSVPLPQHVPPQRWRAVEWAETG